MGEARDCNQATGECAPPSDLWWLSPRSISDGVAATSRSIGRRPATRPDGSPLQGTREIAIFVAFDGGGGVGDIGPVRADGSWTFVYAFDAGWTVARSATVDATRLGVTDTGVVIGTYRPHRISVDTRHAGRDGSPVSRSCDN